MSEQQTKVTVSDSDGKVILQFSKPTTNLVMDPANALPIAEAMARAAYVARYGKQPPQETTALAAQLRSREHVKMRDQMVSRVAIMLHSLREQSKTDGYSAMQIVDTILARVGM